MPGRVMSRVTTAPAPITTSSQMLTGRIVAFEPIETWLPIRSSTPQLAASPRAGPPVAKRVVDEHHAVADEAVVADGHQLADERVRLDAACARR